MSMEQAITGPDGFQYQLVSRSADKQVYRGGANPLKALAIASTPTKNQLVEEEYRCLQEIYEQMDKLFWEMCDAMQFPAADISLPVVQVYGSVVTMTQNGQQCNAFLMQWIDGFDSKKAKPQFERALASLSEEQAKVTQYDLDLIKRFFHTRYRIRDLQVVLEKTTGHLRIFDPRGLDAPGGETPVLDKWEKILRKEQVPSKAEKYDKDD